MLLLAVAALLATWRAAVADHPRSLLPDALQLVPLEVSSGFGWCE